MATNNEIEFKQILNENVYHQIRNTYFENDKPFTQTNYYIDTNDFKLKKHQSALRIRVKDNQYEMTLKVPAKVGLTEYNHAINISPKIDTTISLSQLPEDIRDIIENQFGVSDKELIILERLPLID